MMLRLSAASGAAWIALCASAAAQVQSDEIVVTAPLEGARIDSLQGVVVLDRGAIVESLNGGLGETLDSLPGVASTNYGAGASRPIIRGLGEERVRILQNGVGAIDAAAASPDHALTSDGLDAERIEVLRGAAALAYGGNAVGGVVNILDQSIPTRAPEGGYAIDALAAYTSVNEGREGAIAGAVGVGPVVLRLDASGRKTEDFEIPGATNVDGTGASGEAPNSFAELQSYSGGASFVGDWGFAGVGINRIESEYGLPVEDPAEPGGRIELEQTRIEARGDVRIALGPFHRFDWAVQSADYEHTEFEGDGAAGTVFTNEGYEARLEVHNRGLSERLRGALGVQLSDVDFAADGEEKFIDPTSTRDVGVFVVQRYDAGIGGFEGGVRLERREHEHAPEGGGVISRDFDALSFSAGAFVRPAEGWFLGGTLARTERAPTAVELFALGPHLATNAYEIGDADLDIEVANSMEISLRYTGARIRFEANLYKIDFEDFIALSPTGEIFFDDEENGGPSGFAPDEASIPGGLSGDELILPVYAFESRNADFTGGEVSAALEIARLGGWTWTGDASVDWVRAEFQGGGNVPRIPPRSITLGVSAESENLSLRLEGVDLADQDRIAAFETETEGSTVVNVRATWRPFGANDRLAFVLDGRNLSDEEVRVHSSFLKDVLPRPGRSVRLAVTTSF